VKYVVSKRALEIIERECRNHPDTETGGIIVGLRDDVQVTITHATGPGVNWERSAHHFVKDTDYLQSVLNLLFQYFQVNYLGLWHKHPDTMPCPSGGDVASAMEEISDTEVGLDELVTPICVVRSSQVNTVPYVIKDGAYTQVEWDVVPHKSLVEAHALDAHWYSRPIGQERLAKEMERFTELELKEPGLKVDVKQGTDGTYRFHVRLDSSQSLLNKNRRLVLLCPQEYPVAPPEVAAYDQGSKKYEPVSSQILDDWNIFRLLGDVVEEWRTGSHG